MRHVKQLGGKAIKVHVSQFMQKGTPDILIQIPGFPAIFVEDKLKYNSPSKIQVVRLKEWGEAGMATGVVWSLADFKLFLEYVKENGSGFHGGFKNGNRICCDEW